MSTALLAFLTFTVATVIAQRVFARRAAHRHQRVYRTSVTRITRARGI